MPQTERAYVPTRRYDLQLTIKDKDYTSDLYQLRLVSSLNSPYQIIRMSLFVDPDDIILEKLFGKDPIKLNVRLLGDDEQVSEQVDFNLMYIRGSFQINSRASVSGSQQNKERSTFTITTICRDAFKTVTFPVNAVYLDTTVKGVIEDLASKSGASVEIDSQDANSEVIDQLVIPPTTLKKAIDYLDKRFGIFSGAGVCFCRYDNKLFVKNITSKMKGNQTFTVYQLSTDIDNYEVIKKCNDGKNFYTYTPIDTNYVGNEKFSVEAKTEHYLMTPRDELYYMITKDVKDVSRQYGVIYQSNKIDSDDSALSNREKSFEDPCGYERSDTFTIAKIAKYTANLATMSILIERNMPILNLMNVGEAVKLNSQIVEFTDLSGKYILKSSDINFHKQRDWQTTCRLDLIRTNQTI